MSRVDADRPPAGQVGAASPAAQVAAAVAVVAVTAFTAWLRLGALGPSSLWLDDAWVALVHRTDSLEELRWIGFSAPGFVAGLKVWLNTVGFSETAAQLPAFAAVVAAPAGLYVVARRGGVVAPAALLGATVLATSPIAVTYATRVKPYTTEAVLAVVIIAVALWAVRRPHSVSRWSVVAVVGALSTMVSTFAAPYVAAGFAAGAVAAWRRDARPGQPGVVSARRDAFAAMTAESASAAPSSSQSPSPSRSPSRSSSRSPSSSVASVPARFAGLPAVAVPGAAYGVLALGWYLAVLRPVVTAEVENFWADHYLDVGAGFAASLGRALEGVAAGLVPLPPTATVIVLAVSVVVVVVRRPVTAVLLTMPVLIAVVLAAVHLAPLGGGRTDLYLYPALALLVATAVGEVATGWRRPAGGVGGEGGSGGAITPGVAITPAGAITPGGAMTLGVATLGIAVLVVGATPVDGYPEHDVRPLATELDARRADSDEVVVYPATMWAYALYTDQEVHLAADDASSWGFAPRFADGAVHVPPPGRDDSGVYAATVDGLEADVVWLLASHWRGDLGDLQAMIEDAGYTVVDREDRGGAMLRRYERR